MNYVGHAVYDRAMTRYRSAGYGLALHELSYTELSEQLFDLVGPLLNPGYNIIVSSRHIETWAWVGELLFGPEGLHNRYAMLEGPAMIGALAVKLAIHDHGVQRAVPEVGSEDRGTVEALCRAATASNLASDSITFVVFPYLEGLIKDRCSHYVKADGGNVRPFERLNPRHSHTQRLSSLADALFLFVRTTSSPALAAQLTTILERLADVEGVPPAETNRGYTALYKIRNRALHGEANNTSIWALVLTIALLVGVDEISDDYEMHRMRAAKDVENRGTTSHPHFFYPLN